MNHRAALKRWAALMVLLPFVPSSPSPRARAAEPAGATEPLDYGVSWVGNSFGGAGDKWVQNFFIHMNTAPDGSCYTWSHWDEGGKRFGVYKDGDVVGNKDVKANSLECTDKSGRRWKIAVQYVDPKHNEYDFVP